MRKHIFILMMSCLGFTACSTTSQSECGELICTQEFRMVPVKFSDAAGSPVIVKDFSAINKRTQQPMVQNNEPATINNQGNYIVASDADRKELSEGGDTVVVSATNPKTNEIKKAEFVISGGICACHINKISGPDKIIFK